MLFSDSSEGWLLELTKGTGGVALGMILSGVAWYFYQVRVSLPKQDHIEHELGEVKECLKETQSALNNMARALAAHLTGSLSHTDGARQEAREILAKIDQKHT